MIIKLIKNNPCPAPNESLEKLKHKIEFFIKKYKIN